MKNLSPHRRNLLRRRLQNLLGNIPAYISALRYRMDGDYRRFITTTLKPLPQSPPSSRGTLVLFAHFDAQGLVDPYVRFYLEALHQLGATIVFVSGSSNLDPITARTIEPFCAAIYSRRTLSLDFGSWHLAWRVLQDHGWSLDHFDRLILANDSVFGPLFPLEEMFSSFTGADMYGAIESLEDTPHLQSFFLAWDLNARTRPFLQSFWKNFQYIVGKQALIQACEIGLSTRARAAGLTLKAFVSAAAAQSAFRNAPSHPWAALANTPVNLTLYFWDGLVAELRFPFLKATLPRNNSPWHDSMTNLRTFLEQHTTYPADLIDRNTQRLGLGPSSWHPPAGHHLSSNI